MTHTLHTLHTRCVQEKDSGMLLDMLVDTFITNRQKMLSVIMSVPDGVTFQVGGRLVNAMMFKKQI